jgi:F-box/WD-40 domain protein MET30
MNKKQEKEPLQPFLTKHVPSQIQKLCYRHRPDLVKNRGPDEFDFEKVQHVRSIAVEIFDENTNVF